MDNKRKFIYENYEWDNTWIDNADKLDKKRVLYIGDYKSDLLSEKREITTHVRGSHCSYNLNVKRPGKYKIGIFGHSATSSSSGINIDRKRG